MFLTGPEVGILEFEQYMTVLHLDCPATVVGREGFGATLLPTFIASSSSASSYFGVARELSAVQGLPFFRTAKSLWTLCTSLWRGIGRSQGVCLQKTTQTQKWLKNTSISRVRFEPRIPVFGQQKTVHSLERAVTAIDNCRSTLAE
jgi:hypothetical protein